MATADINTSSSTSDGIRSSLATTQRTPADCVGDVEMRTGPSHPETISPPVAGAQLSVCGNGVNSGRRYWFTKQRGSDKFDHFSWVDPVVQRQIHFSDLVYLQEQVKYLRREIDLLKNKQ